MGALEARLGHPRRVSSAAPGRARVFVYGTLMRGEAAHHLLGAADFRGTAALPPRYTLLDCGWYPALVEGGETAVQGEVFDVDHDRLPALDAFEDAPRIYTRTRRPVPGHGEAWIYLMRPEAAAALPRWAGARWSGCAAAPPPEDL